jgi:Skp family chaperone for outer membrane proteins
MRTILLAAGSVLAALSATAAAQGDAPAASCYIELKQLMAERPTGIGDLGAAIRALDVALRPQVEEINGLKAQLARLEQRDVSATPAATSIEAAFEDDSAAPAQALPPTDDRTAEEIRRVQADLTSRQAKLRADYAAQQQALIGPVQARVNRGVEAFAATSGCAELKMARAADMAALTTAGARNVTGEFVAWYLANPPA